MSIARKKSSDHASLKGPSAKPPSPDDAMRSLRPPPLVASLETSHSDEPAAHHGTTSEQRVMPASPVADAADEPRRSSATRAEKRQRQIDDDTTMLKKERWLVRNGHTMTFVALYMFSVMVLFRPYEIVPGLGFLSATAVYFAIATLALYLPSQLATEGNLTMLSTEVKAVLALTLIAIINMPIAKDPVLAWETFNDPFIKAVLIFIVLVNVVRTRERLMKMMWLSFGIGVYLSISAINSYMKGEFAVEDYRVSVKVGGMFGNPNEMAMHLVMVTPLVIALGIASSGFKRVIYWTMAAFFIAANMVTFSRGGFLGLIAVGLMMAWKIGRKQRLNVSIASIVIGGVVMLAAPGNYGLRMLSIFIPGLDPVGSSDQRKELLERSIWVSLRNPWGIGIGNFPIVGVRNLQTHNAFTQVSSELGILGLVAYLVFMISPFRKLSAIERKRFAADRLDWYYYLSIGLQASIVGYMVSSFFASVAYNWFIYYFIAYAVAFRRVFSVEKDKEEIKTSVQAPVSIANAT